MLITIIHYGCRKSSFYQALSRLPITVRLLLRTAFFAPSFRPFRNSLIIIGLKILSKIFCESNVVALVSHNGHGAKQMSLRCNHVYALFLLFLLIK